MDYQMKILVVEDNLTTRLFIKKGLKKLGFANIVLADDGTHALIEMKRAKFDLILSDWNMPNMDGLYFLQEVKKIKEVKNTPFILITAETDVQKVRQAMRAGVDQYIVKPFSPSALEARIKQAFGETVFRPPRTT
ncbi:MAG: response regulator [Nitrospinae bacterium]|nr:response regulator [Nitrospinota bacterium]